MNNFANMIANLRNAGLSEAKFCNVRNTSLNRRFLSVLYLEGFITGFFISNSFFIRVHLSYVRNAVGELPLVSSLKLVSKPSRRVYVNVSQLLRYYSSKFVILSTSYGILTGTQAIQKNVGGELLVKRYYFLPCCFLWFLALRNLRFLFVVFHMGFLSRMALHFHFFILGFGIIFFFILVLGFLMFHFLLNL